MSISTLDAERIRTAKPKPRQYTIWDRSLRGYGLRVSPSGRKTFVLDITRNGARHKETLGDTKSLAPRQARAAAKARIAAIDALHLSGPDMPFEVMAEHAFRRRERLWKPNTARVNREYLRLYLLPHFTGRTIASITRENVAEWFAGLRDTPAAANRAAPVLSVVMAEAEECGARPEGSNPVRGLRKYRRRKKERVLTRDEMARLGAALDQRARKHPVQAAMIRLLFLTGCRKGELQALEWGDYRDGNLYLRDGKAGPRTVYLSSHARAVLDGLKTRRSRLVFPSPRGGRCGAENTFVDHVWREVRCEAGLGDVRLHDLRHNYASVAIRQGESLDAIGRLLGHRQADTTLRYAHLDDGMMREAVQVVDGAMARSARGSAGGGQ